MMIGAWYSIQHSTSGGWTCEIPGNLQETLGDLVQEESFPPAVVSDVAPDTSQSSAVAHLNSSEQICTRCDRQGFSGGIQIALHWHSGNCVSNNPRIPGCWDWHPTRLTRGSEFVKLWGTSGEVRPGGKKNKGKGENFRFSGWNFPPLVCKMKKKMYHPINVFIC